MGVFLQLNNKHRKRVYKMKIILTTLNAKYIHSSLALRYLKAFSVEDFPDIEIVEYSIKEPLMNMLSELYQKKPQVLGFSCYIWNIEETIELIKLVKKVMPNVKVIIGGPEVSYDITYWMNRVQEVDFIVYGEGELTLNQLLHAIKANNNEFINVNGIAYRQNGEVVVNNRQDKIDLNEMPSPYYDNEDILGLRDKIVYYEASRGCPFSCAYCLSSIETGVRYFSIERVKSDLKKLIDNGVKTIKFVDRTFNIHKKFALEIFEFLINNHKDTIFQFEITADIMQPDVLQYLIDNAPKGIFRFEIGVQSTNEYTNSLVNRRQNFQKLSNTVLKIKSTDKIDQHLDLIAGLPKEDYNSFRVTFNDVFALEPEELQLGFLKMLRGTQIWYEADKYKYVYMDKAPYEILENEILPFSDVIKIKRVEDVLDKYWNSHRMDFTVKYLINAEFETPFDFFQEFGDFWEEKGWNKIGHQIESLFERLNEFLIYRETKNMSFITSLMKLDYFLNHKYKPRKTWWEFQLSKEEQVGLIKELLLEKELVTDDFSSLELDERNIHKHIMIETSDYDIYGFLKNGEIKKQKTLIAVYFQPPEQPKYYFKALK